MDLSDAFNINEGEVFNLEKFNISLYQNVYSLYMDKGYINLFTPFTLVIFLISINMIYFNYSIGDLLSVIKEKIPKSNDNSIEINPPDFYDVEEEDYSEKISSDTDNEDVDNGDFETSNSNSENDIEKKEEASENLEKSKTDIGWGHQIRSYVLQPYQLVKDMRNNLENTDPSSVLDGEINGFLEAALYQTKKNK